MRKARALGIARYGDAAARRARAAARHKAGKGQGGGRRWGKAQQ